METKDFVGILIAFILFGVLGFASGYQFAFEHGVVKGTPQEPYLEDCFAFSLTTGEYDQFFKDYNSSVFNQGAIAKIMCRSPWDDEAVLYQGQEFAFPGAKNFTYFYQTYGSN